MKDVLLKWALKLVLDAVGEYLTPEKVDEGKAKLVAYLRALAKDKTPDFDIDDELVDIVAKALRVA
jgi:hypothetical protein